MRDTPDGRADTPARDTANRSAAAKAEVTDESGNTAGGDAAQRRRRANAMRRRRRRGLITAALLVVLLLLLGLAFFGLRGSISRYFESANDYTTTAGVEDVLVEIPDNSTLSDFGRILEENRVVGSVRAFIDAADGQAMSGGFYKLRTEIPAQVAVRMLTEGTNHRVGRIVVPEGLQLETKEGIDGQTTPGIFEMIANQTAVEINDERLGVSIEQLTEAAATESPEALGVPEWAQAPVEATTGDYRRIEGLIAPGTWESIDPRQTPTEILNGLITRSAELYAQWGIEEENSSGLNPYETLIVASIIEGEVQEVDYSKVARVIVNRLEANQRLEMDSTINYTADVTNIDVFGDSFTSDNPWNTYRNEGLPPTPIGSVGEQVLGATEDPEPGNWRYFVTIDREGTTLFADTYEQHIRNRDEACRSGLIATGCS